jgi:hypothetical protein
VIAPATGTFNGAEAAMRFRFVRRSPGGVLDAWQCARRVRRSAGPPDVRPIGTQDGLEARPQTVTDGLAVPMTRAPDGERPSHADDA